MVYGVMWCVLADTQNQDTGIILELGKQRQKLLLFPHAEVESYETKQMSDQITSKTLFLKSVEN